MTKMNQTAKEQISRWLDTIQDGDKINFNVDEQGNGVATISNIGGVLDSITFTIK